MSKTTLALRAVNRRAVFKRGVQRTYYNRSGVPVFKIKNERGPKRVIQKGKFARLSGDWRSGQPRVIIPQDADWTLRGVAIEPSSSQWDHRLAGHSPSDAIVMPDGSDRTAIFYVGASGNRADGGPAFRKVGVAFSANGRRPFVKHPDPVITHTGGGSINLDEEGVYSCAVAVDDDGVMWVFYGAIEATGLGSVDVFIHVAKSRDGITWTDHRRIPGIDTVAGELWPFTALYRDGVFYLWCGRRNRIDLLRGPDPYTLTRQRSSGLHPSEHRELGSSVVHLGGGRIAMLYDAPMRVSTARIGTPTQWTASEQFRMPEGVQGKTWLLNRDSGEWFLYVMRPDDQAIRIWSAPM